MIRPDPGPARDWVREELARREYQPSLLERIVGWFGDFLDKLTGAARDFGRLDPVVAGVVIVLLVLVLALALARLRPDPTPRRRAPEALLPDTRLTAAAHRDRAERALGAGRFEEAVVEALRALASGLVERAIIDDLPGATAREVTARAAAAFPHLAPRLGAAADLFDGVRYGDRHVDREAASAVLSLDHDLGRERPVAGPNGPVAAVPR